MEISFELVTAILAVLFGILTAVFGTKYAKFKKVFNEVKDLAETFSIAIDDDKITKEELKKIIIDANAVIGSIKALLKK